jgi:hypothetical protein
VWAVRWAVWEHAAHLILPARVPCVVAAWRADAAVWSCCVVRGACEQSVDELMSMPDIDGCLVGGASLDPEKFTRIMNFQ